RWIRDWRYDEECAARELDSSGPQHRLRIPAARVLSIELLARDRPTLCHADPDHPRGTAPEVLLRPDRDPRLAGRPWMGVPTRLRAANGPPRVTAAALGPPVAPPWGRARPRTLAQALRAEPTLVTRE